MFDTSSTDHPLSMGQSQDNRLDRRKPDVKGGVSPGMSAGVVGVAVRSTADLSQYETPPHGHVDLDDDDVSDLYNLCNS